MGVPAFFRWISEKYPKILTRCLEESGNVDASKPNPNNYEFDNFYLDMNGLIHPCTHPEGEEAPATEEEMYQVIFRYLDRLFNMIRPRKVIYMAIDGVAPRAKMNQQRSRRFRSAAEAAEADEDADRIRKEMIGMGLKPPPKKKPTWDSNVITPGTEFMAKLSEWVRYYIAERLNTNPAFRNVRVILSDAQSPGEGEHKIMQFIRRERAEPGYDPNTTHVLYGLDADLIMLGLASHEVHFTILREEVLFGKAKKQRQDTEGYKVDSVLLNNNSAGGQDPQLELAMADAGMIGKPKKPFDLVRLWILREYLIFEFRPETFYQPLTFEYNFEACIDDFVFICFFVGNDFLPHLPSLSIREGGLELLLDLYKRVLPTVRGYLTTDGKVNLDRVDVYMAVLGTVEDEIFLRRRQQELYDKQRRENMNKTKKLGGKLRALGAAAIDKAEAVVSTRKRKTRDNDTPVTQPVAKKPAPGKDENKSAAAALRAKLKGTNLESSSQQQDRQQQDESKGKEKDEDDNEKEAEFGDDDDEEDEVLAEIEDEPSDPYEHIDITNYVSCDSKEALEEFEKRAKEKEHARNVHEDVKDEVRLGESGWKDRYYVSKFGEAYRDPNSPERKRIVKEYVTGLCWVMEYYYKGCQSWTWFYPYHYAPFASDMVNIDKINIEFPPSMPFKPIEQLMGVFPPASAHALPEPCRWYMTSIDSPIADFYPTKFEYDPNGKAVRWLWIALLPFIDEKRLLKVSAEIEKEFTAAEKARNSFNPDLIFSRVDAPGTDQMIKAASDFQKRQEARAKLTKNKTLESEKVELTSTPTTAGDVRQGQKDCGRLLLSTDTHGVSGYFMPPPPEFEFVANEEITPPSRKLEPIQNNKVVCFEFRLPKMKPHLCRLIQGVSIPPPCLSMADLHTRAPRLSRGAQVGNLLIERHGPHPSIIRGPPVPFGAFPHQQHQQQFPGAMMMQPQMPPNMGYHQQQRHQQPYAHGTNQPRPKHFRGNYDQDYSQRQQQYQQPHHSRGGYGAGNRYDRGGGYGGHRNDGGRGGGYGGNRNDGGRGGGYGNRYDGGRGGRYDDRRSNASQQGHHQHQGQYSRQDSRDHRGGQGYGQHRGGQSSHHFQNYPPPQHHAPPQHAQQAAPRPPPPPPPNFGGGSASNSGGYSNRSALMDSLSAALKNRKR